ncbi:Pimeloyl-ACP methyl ester carboxylesterase [Yoonia tamlensis]|uniref:Pimeloyl-ACP methyl ester carboxylesterase n=1 Tax=Yoonia tamlensis TaxID=390270 RepID=A0A1I6FTA2_9RHOB|nr:alpha/beta fold hydrolase [Yoonia tamlensis]SFR33153.1 Pimeloyl-ACP methyl ester carboxylesterase [Yoonia tamlensis]
MPDSDIDHFAEPIMVEIDGTFSYVHVDIWEPKEPKKVIFLIHDLVGRSDDFAPLAPRLAALGYRVVAVDLPGRGKSAWLEQDQYTGKAYVEVLLSAMRAHWLPDASILGQGWGAMIALLLETVARLRFSKLLLLDLPQKWSITADQTAALWEQIIVLRAEDETTFWKSVEEIVPRGLTGRRDFMALAGERARDFNGKFGLSADPKVFSAMRQNPDVAFDLEALLSKVRTEILMFQGLRSLAPYRSFRPSVTVAGRLRRIRVLRATNISWKSDDILMPVLGAALAHNSN